MIDERGPVAAWAISPTTARGGGTSCMGPWMSRVKTWREPLFFFLSARTEVGRASHRTGRRRSTSRVRRRRPDRWACVRNVYDTRWSPLRLAMIIRSSCHILVCGGSYRILTMMQLYASAARLRSSGGPFFFPACKPRGLCERPLPRIVHGGSPLIAAIRQILILLFARFGSASFYAADLNSKPSGTTPVLT